MFLLCMIILYILTIHTPIWWHSLIDQVRQLPIIGSDTPEDSWADNIDDELVDDGPIQDLPEGASCVADDNCVTGFCDGICKRILGTGERCGSKNDDECAGSLRCALDERDGKYICCNNVATISGFKYCHGIANDKKCFSDGVFDAMCSSGFCDGTCKPKKKEGETCPSQKNRECSNNSCYRSTRYGDYMCCKNINFCGWLDKGCQLFYYYCADYGSKLG